MIYQRIQRSILHPEAIGVIAAAKFGLTKCQGCDLLRSSRSDSYVLESSSGVNLVRVAPADESALDLLNELHTSEQLRALGAAVIAPIRTQRGRLLVPLAAPEGVRYAMLFPWVMGSPLTETHAHIRQAGQSIAELHARGSSLRCVAMRNQADLERLVDGPVLRRIVPARTEYARRFMEQVRIWRARFTEQPVEQLAVGFRHGDPHRGNCRINEEGIWWLDLEYSGTGWLSYDLAVFMWDLLHELRPAVEEANILLAQLIGGYRELRALRGLDAWAVSALIGLRELWLVDFHARFVDDWGVGWLDDQYFSRATQVMELCIHLMT